MVAGARAAALLLLVWGRLFFVCGRWKDFQKLLHGWCEDEDGAQHGDREEGPQENPVQHLSYKLPVLHHLNKEIRGFWVFFSYRKFNQIFFFSNSFLLTSRMKCSLRMCLLM